MCNCHSFIDRFEHVINGKRGNGSSMHRLNFHTGLVNGSYLNRDDNIEPIELMIDSGVLYWQRMAIRNNITGLLDGQQSCCPRKFKNMSFRNYLVFYYINGLLF